MIVASPPADRPHPLFARVWALAMARLQPKSMREERAELVCGLSGLVVEVGAGSGTMFRHYPATVEQVVAIEPEPYLRAAAQRAVGDARVAIDVRPGDAARLPFEDGSVDAVVCSLVLCSVPDQAGALAEFARVLRPGGELRYYEHVAEQAGSTGRRLQDRLDSTGLWARIGGGCHVARETGEAIRAAGFCIVNEREQTLGPPLVVPVRRHLLGVARKPAG
ncbi:MAG: methyltransferase domain-containing protein [Solirubrobacteraceae bacterium]|nr:methyltransferase domain-containing protein [Solirubrobacteraceae bacterium]